MSSITATDLKRFAYCPLIPYYEKVMGIEERVTEAMKEGSAVDVEVAINFVRPRPVQVFKKPLLSWKGVTGSPDFLLMFQDSASPLEVKSSREKRRDHRLQLELYCLLAERSYRVRKGYLYYPARRELVTLPYGEEERREVLRSLDSLKRVLREGAKVRQPARKCVNCGYLRYCRPKFEGGVAYAES
ncbi:CRISPR-associated protein Cas4 [Sulfodiicoccus acidiphilus]|uniref:CRISPR-associated exonuclease Cas4 n=1 Tax=Sulfodiicoccus acidiphilus TaxID=1670455 RepID=A0A348B5B0_9CREN|nr:CRISPR-associated protein Cas4 [Sulfodiicoccus acidiphilus]BBD73362.1 CRISPR-associated protein Cas4 [Sulfodiicoccus acidiphilus]GGU00935.1 CRISPR-associated protein Cas4 [Sulfodiicoccus acidiphilus]